VSGENDFIATYEKYVWDIYGFLAYRTRSREEAEDLTQETFERALKAWSRFDPTRNDAKPWLLVIARNAYIDSRRRERSRPSTVAADGDSEQAREDRALALTGGPEPEVAEALAGLKRREREALALRFGGDLKTAEVAEVLDISVANAQQILSRALRRMRELMDEGSPGSGAEGAGTGDADRGDGK